jgi:GNAT superfamily N-acetyltransferase
LSRPVTDRGLRIRRYRAGDDHALMRVCLETGDAGEDATPLLRLEPALISEVYLLPYLALEPSTASVVAADGVPPQGYVLGAPDTRAFEAAAEERWWPALRRRYPIGAFPHDTLETILVHLLHHPRIAPEELVREYPSHLHIDLLASVQGDGWGRRLLERLFTQLVERGSPGVHLGVSEANTGAIAFYRRMGFEPWPEGSAGVLTLVRRLHA